jgi:cysteine synthase B
VSGRRAALLERPEDALRAAGTAARRSAGVSHETLEALIGGTPLLDLPRWGPPRVRILAKAEHLNPGGSVKDRPALRIVREALAAGLLGTDRVLLDSSSGNTGIAFAMLSAGRPWGVEICIPANANPQRKRLLRAYGASVVETDPLEGSDGAAEEARRRVSERPDRYFYANQYDNPANWRAHYDTTGPEIWRQTAGAVTHWVAGVGTGGTFTGVARRLREMSPAVRCLAVQPDAPFHGLEGMKHLASSAAPGIWDASLAEEILEVRTEEAQATARRLARETGILVGTSSGANVAAAVRVAERLREGVVVSVLCDGGSRYLEEPFWDETGPARRAGTAQLPNHTIPAAEPARAGTAAGR